MCVSILTVSGLPGSGTSTACGLLCEQLGWNYANAGQIFRELAEEAGLSLAEFGRRAEGDPAIDRQLDARMVEIARQTQPIVLEGRMTGWMAARSDLGALKVWLQAADELRAGRVAKRDGQTVAEALHEMRVRQGSEVQRYQEHHGIDIGDLAIYDLVIDSERMRPDAIVAHIVAALDAP